ncbi:hypothetical protein QJS04_geneDACA016558 [Acorus gramineus]|uniref:Uncharacterized protein n=1 Tax=Acorus gramineus TaxID=55184 RepID=A0AAV9BMK8_ACOGR|nr:hypothetical protein QJS04_geneDACA016558 [Acorus gramineus]
MLSLPKTRYIIVGLLEALGAASGMAAGAVLSGESIPILSQEIIFLDAARQLKRGQNNANLKSGQGTWIKKETLKVKKVFVNGCEGAPLLPVLFVIVNMAFNISLLHLIKISSAVVSCLASTFSDHSFGVLYNMYSGFCGLAKVHNLVLWRFGDQKNMNRLAYLVSPMEEESHDADEEDIVSQAVEKNGRPQGNSSHDLA